MNKIKIFLDSLKLKTFTEQDAEDYCMLNSINPDKIIDLWLSHNKLTDISGIKLFKNLKYLYINDNKIKDISALKNLTELEMLDIKSNNIKDISVVQSLIQLKIFHNGYNEIKDISVLKYLINIEILDIKELKLESDQIKYINSLKDLKQLYCQKGFKDMSVLNQLNKNIKMII